jgi:hypothetical protein
MAWTREACVYEGGLLDRQEGLARLSTLRKAFYLVTDGGSAPQRFLGIIPETEKSRRSRAVTHRRKANPHS